MKTEGRHNDTKTTEPYTVVGLKDIGVNIKRSLGGSASSVKFDSTTYPDRCILQITHATIGGAAIKLLGGSIKGKTVSMLAGGSGYRWDYSDYSSIEKNGESSVKIANDYITSAAQCKAVGDYEWKESRYHPEYTVEISGMRVEYQVGDTWLLDIDYSLNGNVVENINTNVIVESVSYGRSATGIGSTVLGLRVPSSAWALTMAKNATLSGAGKVNWKGNRSNILTVAASDYVGQADFYCDGTADHADIQAAIDAIADNGGGEVRLTNGTFIVNTLTISSSIKLIGEGKRTILKPQSTVFSSNMFINILDTEAISVLLMDFSIDGNGVNIISPATSFEGIRNNTAHIDSIVTIDKVSICNIYTTTINDITMISSVSTRKSIITNCYIYNITGTAEAMGIFAGYKCIGNIISTFSAAMTSAFFSCRRCLGNATYGSFSDRYYNSYADAGTVNPCADTAAGGYNS